MMRAWPGRLVLGVAALGSALACAPSVPPEYAKRAAAAERAYVHGRYAEAAVLWTQAASAAEGPADAHEARYRSAVSLLRAGERDAARSALRGIATEGRGRSARALFDLAVLADEDGDAAGARGYWDRLVQRHPRSGLASRAVERRIATLREEGSETDVRAYLRRLHVGADADALGERIAYEIAESHERDGELRAAADAFRDVARRYPYPHGALWDNALYRSAELRARLGEPREAIAELREMLDHREHATITGSYERPSYADAQFMIGELYRDALDDPRGARREFLKLWGSSTTSRLRDDAKWQAALLAARLGDDAAACRDVRDLANHAPESRYAACGAVVCSEVTSSADDCRSYIRREAATVLAGGGERDALSRP